MICKWIVDKLGENTPVHFSRFHPDHNITDIPKTPMNTLMKIYDVAKETGILYPYLGNVSHGDYENTFCPKCGNVCITRSGYYIITDGFTGNKCLKCGNILPIATN